MYTEAKHYMILESFIWKLKLF